MNRLASFAVGLGALALGMGSARAAELSLWARATTEAYSVAVVKAWNDSHADKITLNLIPNEQFVAKVGTAIAAGSPPDLMSIDLVYVPSFARAEQFTDLTALAKTLPFFNKLSPSHIRLGTFDGKVYALPYSATFIPGEKDGQWSSFAGGDAIAIPQGSKQAKIAWQFIEWTYSPEVQVGILARNHFLPVRTDLADNEFTAKEPAYLVAAQAIARGKTPYSFVYNDLLNSPQGPFLRMLQRAVFDGDITGAVAEAQKRFTQIIDQDR